MSSPPESPARQPGNENELSLLLEAQGTIKQLSEILKSMDSALIKLASIFEIGSSKRRKRKEIKNEIYFVESRPAAILTFK
jgi:hypothetical protein